MDHRAPCAQIAVHDIIDGFRLSGDALASVASNDDEPAYAALFSMLRHNAEMVKVRTASGQIFTANVQEQVAPRALLGGALAGAGGYDGGGGDGYDAGEERGPDAVGFEGAPASALDRVEAFLQLSRRELRAERDTLEKMLWAGGGREPRILGSPKHHVSVFFPLFWQLFTARSRGGEKMICFSPPSPFPQRKKDRSQATDFRYRGEGLWSRDDAMSAGHDCTTPVSGTGVAQDAAAAAATAAVSTTTSTTTTTMSSAIASAMSAMSLQKKVDGQGSLPTTTEESSRIKTHLFQTSCHTINV